jgi:hypothetical protein
MPEGRSSVKVTNHVLIERGDVHLVFDIASEDAKELSALDAIQASNALQFASARHCTQPRSKLPSDRL